MSPRTDIKIGDIYAVCFEGKRNEQSGWRPAVVIQNSLGNTYSKNVVVLPITSSETKGNLITHVKISSLDSGLRRDSIVLCENPVTIPKVFLKKHITTLSEKYIKDIAVGHTLASGIVGYLSEEEVLDLWMKSREINQR